MKSFSLDPDDVHRGGMSSSSGRRKARFSRANATTSTDMTLMHGPTGVSVSGNIPPGHYSRKEMRKLDNEMYAKLYSKLEAKVAKHLRVPGR